MMEILAHRGYWQHKAEQNTPQALRGALVRRLSIETDIRERAGRLVISHDLPNTASPSIETLSSLLQDADPGITLALNVKADGLAALCAKHVSAWRARVFFFDMSVPDMRDYLKHELPVFTRHSDAEPTPAFYRDADGVWLDQLEREWIEPDTIRAHLNAGKRVAVVSSELHGRNPTRLWEVVIQFKNNKRVSLCTDHVDQARDVFGSGGGVE